MEYTGFDLLVLVIVGLAAVGGLLRGFVHETLSLAAWVAAVAAIYYLHEPLTGFLVGFFEDNDTNAGLLAFVLLLIVPYVVMKLVAKWAGSRTRESVLGFVDRILGLGFGVVKGAILVVLSFSILALGYDTAWGAEGRPDWIKEARSYPFVNAASNALVETIAARREAFQEEAAQ
ncbi:CvpA family protein [Croceicoccus mobilis]|uniref:Colicin V production protein n=1 Tax=Croceicoccus mobilis TaxID=1703339 RepID=A0A916YWJ7_9SPHN|nr:CvpA family protein [Croceicoccus mobilis]GGD64974.1 hypothetical protein GCM10010990_13060 [Croceicoccus mobilis]